LTGIGASKGIGIGKIVVLKEHTIEYVNQPPEDTEAEIKRLQDAILKFTVYTQKLAENVRENVGNAEAEIIEGHILIISDPMITDEITASIQAGNCAEEAVKTVCDNYAAMFAAIPDELMQQRSSDIGDVKTRLLKILLGIEEVDIAAVAPGTVLVARDLTPSMTASIVKENVAGILTEVGGKTSHSAILARALEIPAVLSIPDLLNQVKDNDTVVLNGTTGEVYLNPSEDVQKEYEEKRAAYLAQKQELEQYRGKATVTQDGAQVELFGNIGKPEDAKLVNECDGEGVGLFRTEFLFMGASSIPTEEEQFEAYKKAAVTLEGKTVIIRTLDVGGDKEIPYLGLEKEDNPFLGFRAVRYCLQNEAVYKPQLRALLRASAFGDVRIMVPLVTCVDEIRAVKELVKTYMSELDREGIAYNPDIQVGVMIETPAASLIADVLAKEADFFSIGTNDLTQYTMAVDRGNAKVAYLYSPFQPAVLRSIKHIITCAKKEGISVGMCGEAAADPLLIPLLVAWGLDEFSVTPATVLATRKAIHQVNYKMAEKIDAAVLNCTTEQEVVEILKRMC
jgi:phosphotransferase system enzyme I (PtsI)